MPIFASPLQTLPNPKDYSNSPSFLSYKVWSQGLRQSCGDHSNHAITVTAVARDPMTCEIQAFFLKDNGTGKAAQFVDVPSMREAWEEGGGSRVLTAEVRNY